MNRIDRISAILIQLQSRKIVKAQEIAERFEISLRTVYRDIHSLYEAGIPIIGEAGVGYSLADGYKLPPVMFTNEEATALLTAEKLVKKLTDKATSEVYQSALTKIKATLRSTGKEYLSEIEDHIEVINSPFQAQSFGENQYIQSILKAISQKAKISIDYFATSSQEHSQRNIEPIGIFFQHNRWYLLAFCCLRNDYRQFRLDRINGVVFTNESFENKHPTLKAYLEETPKQGKKGEHKVILRLHQSIERYLGDQKHYMGLVSQKTIGNTLELTFQPPSLESFARWCMMFADHVEIEGPAEVKDKMRELATKILQSSQNIGLKKS